MRQRGHQHLLLDVDDTDLEERLFETLKRLYREKECVRDGIGRTVARNLQLMARMGMYFERYGGAAVPGISFSPRPTELGRLSAVAQPGASQTGRDVRSMNFLELTFFSVSARRGTTCVIQEIRGGEIATATGNDLLALVAKARGFLAGVGLKKGDRCALLAPNSIRWVASDLALMAEGIIVVPLYARQAAGELAVMIRDSGASRICCENRDLREALCARVAGSAALLLFEEIFAARPKSQSSPFDARAN